MSLTIASILILSEALFEKHFLYLRCRISSIKPQWVDNAATYPDYISIVE
jgi:hypothetical protein